MKSIETNTKERIKILRGNEYFDDLPETMLQEISAHMHLREYQRGDVLFWEGDPCDGLYIVKQGSAKIFRLSPQGGSILSAFCKRMIHLRKSLLSMAL
jgi:CRP-like cAMP-binding protein